MPGLAVGSTQRTNIRKNVFQATFSDFSFCVRGPDEKIIYQYSKESVKYSGKSIQMFIVEIVSESENIICIMSRSIGGSNFFPVFVKILKLVEFVKLC